MADNDPNAPENRRQTERVSVDGRTGNASLWWIAGALVLAALIVGFIVLSGGEPAPVEPTTEITEPAPEPAPETAPVEADPEVEAAPEPEVEAEPEAEVEVEVEPEAEPAE